MTGLEEDDTTMFELMRARFTLAPAGFFAGIPGATVLVDTFLDTLDAINAKVELQSTDISGYAAAKATKKETMVDKILFLSMNGKSLAVTNEDEVLEGEMNWTKSNLLRLPDTVAASTSKRIVDLVEGLLPEIVDYGVTVPIIADARVSVADFRAAMSTPRTNIVDRSDSTKSIATLIRKCTKILKKIDVKIGPSAESFPEYVSKYFESRRVIRTGTRTLALKGTVTDADGVPLEKVTITFEGLRLVKKTTAKGNFQVKHFEPGTYTAIYRLLGYDDVVEEFYIIEGMRRDVNVVMQAVGVEA